MHVTVVVVQREMKAAQRKTIPPPVFICRRRQKLGEDEDEINAERIRKVRKVKGNREELNMHSSDRLFHDDKIRSAD